ncbi:MAG: ankyrin repeat domain-containing protein [Acidobacteriota bacterium]
MQSSKIVSAAPMRRMLWCLALMFGFALLLPHALLRAASTAVVDAARSDRPQAVQDLIKDRADVNATSNDGSSALLWAAFHSNVDMTKALLAAGAKVDAENRYGVTPLLQASRNGDIDVMKVLLDAGAQPTRWHAEGETPLMAASRTGRVDAVKLLLSRGSFVNAVDPFQEETALMWASAEGHAEVVKTLLAAGADPNLKAHVSQLTQRKNTDHPSGGFTALMFAARNGHTEVVKVLMAGGADPKLTNADGATATVIAIVNDRFDLAKELVDLGADPNDGALFFAVDMHDATTDMRAHDGSRLQPNHPNHLDSIGLVKALLDLGADVNKPFVGALHSTTLCCAAAIKSSPFYRAASAADVEVLKLMLAHGAKIDWSPSQIKTDGKPSGRGGGTAEQPPLMVAMRGGQGASFAAGPGFGRLVAPPFREPGSRDPVEAVKLLLAAGADPNTKMSDGSTPIHQAVQAQQVGLIRTLVAAGGSLEAVNKDKLTPLGAAEKLKNTPPPPPTVNDEEAYRPKRDSREDVVVALRELMHLGPNDPVPAPPPALAEAGKSADQEKKNNSETPVATPAQ